MTRSDLIAQNKAGYDEVVPALAGADDAALDRRPGPGTWFARDILHHLADSEITGAVGLRRLLAEYDPLIVGYDQDVFAALLHDDRPIAASLDAFRAARVSCAELLDRLRAPGLRESRLRAQGSRVRAQIEKARG